MLNTTVDNVRQRRLSLALPALDAPRLGLALLCVSLVSLALLHATDPDYWWHLRTGRIIVETHSVTTHDPFPFTAPGKHWVAHEWLSEVLIYAVQSAGAYAANAILFAVASLCALLIAYQTALSFGLSRRVGLALLAWSGVMSLPYWVVRPQAFTWLLLAAFVGLLVQHRNGRNRLWLLPPIMVLWANLHLGHFFGIAVVGLYVLSLAAERLVWSERRELKSPLLALAGCVAATLLTPNPLSLLLYPLDYLRPGNAGIALIAEWQSPDFHAPLHLPLAAALLALVALGVFGWRRDLFIPGLALAFGFLALQSSRNQPLFAPVFLVVAGSLLADRFAWARDVERDVEATPAHGTLNLALLATVALDVAAVVASAPQAQLGRSAKLDGTIDYPQAGVAYIRANYPGARMFNPYDWGGYLIDALYPEPVFIDGRSDFYGDFLLRDYETVTNVAPGWQGVLDDYDVDLVLAMTRSPLSDRLDSMPPSWRRVFTGPFEAVFVRTASSR